MCIWERLYNIIVLIDVLQLYYFELCKILLFILSTQTALCTFAYACCVRCVQKLSKTENKFVKIEMNNTIYQPLRSGRIWHKVNF